MSKFARETIQKAERFLAKKQVSVEGRTRKEFEELLSRAADLANELRTLKEAAREKRLDIEDNARVLSRLTNKAKRAAESARKAASKSAKREQPPEPENAAQKKPAPPKRTAAEGAASEAPGGV